VKSIINVNGVCYHRYEKRLEQQKVVQMLIFALQKNIWMRNYDYNQYSINYHFNSNKHTQSFYFFFVIHAFWVLIVRICFLVRNPGLLEITEWEHCMWLWTQTSWQVMQRDSNTAGSGKLRIVLCCVKRSMSRPVAVLPQVLKIHSYCETVMNVLIRRLFCRLRFTQYKNTWLVRIRKCTLWDLRFYC